MRWQQELLGAADSCNALAATGFFRGHCYLHDGPGVASLAVAGCSEELSLPAHGLPMPLLAMFVMGT